MHTQLRTIVAALALCTPPLLAQSNPTPQGRPKPAAVAAQSSPTAQGRPKPAAAPRVSPDSFTVRFWTSKGPFTVAVLRPWAPRGADRVFLLVRDRYYDGVAFYRVIPGFMAQFGFNGDPAVTKGWDAIKLADEPVRVSNTRGIVTFATAGPGSRTTQLFVNLANNENLDGMGFAPIGMVRDGMSAVESLYSGYGEGSPRGPGPDQRRMALEGNKYLKKNYPKLDFIDSARVIQAWPAVAPTAGRSGKP